MSVSLRRLTGAELQQALPDLANLRIEVFRDFPYLYEGSFDYEKNYLNIYTQSSRCAVIAAYDGSQMIGAATALPLLDEADYVQKPFLDAGFDLSKIFYFGESILKKSYRGQGLGHAFFDGREEVALSFPEYTTTCFCAVQRSEAHPLRPQDYQPLNSFWEKRGYRQAPELQSEFHWQDIDQPQETGKTMVYWLKSWTR